MEKLQNQIALLKDELNSLKGDRKEFLTDDQQLLKDIELTYTSNAIEGNTLTLDQTSELIQHGITVGGKKLDEHLEAKDHYDALVWMRSVASSDNPIGEKTILELHRRIVASSRKEIAGMYSQSARRIYGSDVIFPNPLKIPTLMENLGRELSSSSNTPAEAFSFHHRLVSIHPFDDGNGRTARLLMNMILLRGGYVPVTIGPEQRSEYLSTIREAQINGDAQAPAFQEFMHLRLIKNMQEYIEVLREGKEGRERQQSSALTPEQLAFLHRNRGPGI
ncbi:Fic family protein [Erythrobacter tepidarius]|uniref:Fic family protein n=1 Tax=Erythrobacter tepidarius TaxID=60454 RepID=UPI000A3A7993|nr:Fic family protein [Erythrobacter tepidarius]